MISKNELKYYSSLLQKKFRDKENKFLVEGKKIIEEGMKLFSPEVVFITQEFKDKHENFIRKLSDLNIAVLKDQDFKKISDTVHSQGIAAAFKKQSPEITKLNFKENLIVFLDNISDPGNLGTIIRNCDWFGVNQILLSKGCADIYNPKTIRSSMGSIFHINIFENISPDFLKELHNNSFHIMAADINGSNVFEENFSQNNVIIFSNEAHGISPIALSYIDKKVGIQKFGKAESLNVASASAAILSFIRFRQIKN